MAGQFAAKAYRSVDPTLVQLQMLRRVRYAGQLPFERAGSDTSSRDEEERKQGTTSGQPTLRDVRYARMDERLSANF